MKIRHSFLTDIGLKRQQNQDNGIACPDEQLYIVADGMGGHQGGETASQMVVDMLPKCIKKAQKKKDWDPRITLQESLEEVSTAIHERSDHEKKLRGMGTTTIAMLFKNDDLVIGHVGDSRAYFLKQGKLWQLTRDHSLVQEKLRAGLITREQLKTDQMRNVITRSVGFETDVEVDLYEMKVEVGDLFLMCSDGLSGLVEDVEISRIVDEEYFRNQDLDATVQALVRAANENGGDDNITSLMVEIASD